MTKRNHLRNISFLLACLVVSAGVWFFFGDSIRERLSRQRFDEGAWKASEGNGTNPVRIRMVDDLLSRHSFLGMTRDQVTGIIGDPDKTDYSEDWNMVYWLGPERGFMSIDSEWLVFQWDGQKKVTGYRIVRD